MTRLAPLLAVLVLLSACGSDPTSTPTAPAPSVFAIGGTVFGNGKSLAGATVTITDGIYAGQERDTTNDGGYFFPNLAPSVVTLQATYPDYAPQTKTVNLTTATTATQRVDFVLTDH